MKRDPGPRPPGFIRVRHHEADVDGIQRPTREEIVDNSCAVVEWDLRRRGVSPAIIERVLRLNPRPMAHLQLRGIHYKPTRSWGFPAGLVQKGEVLRVYGRDVWARIPRDRWVKNGRRVWVSAHDVWRARRPHG